MATKQTSLKNRTEEGKKPQKPLHGRSKNWGRKGRKHGLTRNDEDAFFSWEENLFRLLLRRIKALTQREAARLLLLLSFL